jgi:hypothetical protein
MMWQHLLCESGNREIRLFDADQPKPLLQFERLPLIQISQAVPESSWTRTDPHAKDMEASDPDLFETEEAA